VADQVAKAGDCPHSELLALWRVCVAKTPNHFRSNSGRPLMLEREEPGAMTPGIAADAPVLGGFPDGANQFPGGSFTSSSPAPSTAHYYDNHPVEAGYTDFFKNGYSLGK
jgi:hypothetical protein